MAKRERFSRSFVGVLHFSAKCSSRSNQAWCSEKLGFNFRRSASMSDRGRLGYAGVWFSLNGIDGVNSEIVSGYPKPLVSCSCHICSIKFLFCMFWPPGYGWSTRFQNLVSVRESLDKSNILIFASLFFYDRSLEIYVLSIVACHSAKLFSELLQVDKTVFFL